MRTWTLTAALTLVSGGGAALSAQQTTTYEACYVPSVGAVYLLNRPGLPTSCLGATHVAVTWTDGGILADGAVTEAKLAFDPTTQAELDDFIAGLAAAGTINADANPVEWTQLRNVPAGLADGVDNDGGTPSDLACTGCVNATDLADGAVEGTALAVAAVDLDHLAFDPTTQAELDAVASRLAAAGRINARGNPVSWTQLFGVPPGLADGIDNGAVTDHASLTGLGDDDHPQYLLAGVRDAPNGFAVSGTFGAGTIPVSGGGTRMMWYPERAAFRAGRVLGVEWDVANVGLASTAIGSNALASGLATVAMGESTRATGNFSTAFGVGTRASGQRSTAMGDASTAAGVASTAMGTNTTAQSMGSLVIGRENVSTGSVATWVDTDPLLVAGNGTPAAPSNALTLLKNGDLTIAGTLTQSSDIRLKEDIEPLGDALNGILGLIPIRYRFRPGTGHPSEPQIGLSAQEVERAFPELVTTDAEGHLSVAYANLTAVLVRAMQEQQEETQGLLATVREQQAQIGLLLARPEDMGLLRAEVEALRAALAAGPGR